MEKQLLLDITEKKGLVKVGDTTGQNFFCRACLTAKPAGEQDSDSSYCRFCHAMLKAEQKTVPHDSLHWEGEVCFHDGLAWSTELVPIETTQDGRKRWDAKPICLGREAVILPILKGKALITADIKPRRKAVLKGILERSIDDRRDREEENVQAKSTRGQRVVRSGGLRARLATHAKHGPVNTRHLKAA